MSAPCCGAAGHIRPRPRFVERLARRRSFCKERNPSLSSPGSIPAPARCNQRSGDATSGPAHLQPQGVDDVGDDAVRRVDDGAGGGQQLEEASYGRNDDVGARGAAASCDRAIGRGRGSAGRRVPKSLHATGATGSGALLGQGGRPTGACFPPRGAMRGWRRAQRAGVERLPAPRHAESGAP